MRNVWSAASVVAAGLFAVGVQGAAAQTGFNGTLTYQIQSENGKTVTLVTKTQGNKTRMEMADPANPARSGAFVIDNDAHTRTVILDSQKKYMVIPENMANMMNGGAATPNTSDWKFTKTGKTETVAGVSCEVVHASGTANGHAEEADACVAKGVGFNPGTFASMSRPGAATDPGIVAMRDAIGAGNGIIKVVTTKDGKPGMTMVVTNIDRTAPSADAFSPPAGYTTMQMGGMPGAGTKP
jgi:uncharacterized protein DUF4412